MSHGLIDANYGGGLFKKRIGTKGRRKRGSIRTLLAFKVNNLAIFLYGFEKNERDNLTKHEEKAYKILTRSLLEFSQREINTRVNEGSLIEVQHEQKQIN